MQSILIILIVGVLLGGGYFWYEQQSKSLDGTTTTGIKGLMPPDDSDIQINNSPNNTNTGGTGGTTVNVGVETGASVDVVQEFTFSNEGFTFTPAAFAVKKGDRVKVTFKNTVGTHDFRIEDYNVGTNVIQSGKSQTFEFTADKAGTFEFYCSVGNHRSMGMKGTFTVTQ